MKLNKPQLIAANHRDGPALVLAGPGSGKTAVITRRALNLIGAGIPPENILVITFTKDAAAGMRARFEKQAPYPPPPVTFGTFHSVFYNILCHEAGLNANNIATDEVRYRILKDILLKVSKKDDDEAGFIKGVLDEISAVKSLSTITNSYQSKSTSTKEFFELYKAYNKEMLRLRLVDFDDMIILTKRLFMRNEEARRAWSDRYQYIMVDEFQDVNEVQYEVVKLLARPRNNIFVVGDDDQTIYGFRGSRPDIMQRFPKDFTDNNSVTLNINYRSTPQIVRIASKVIKNNVTRYDKKLVSAKELDIKGAANKSSEVKPGIKVFEDVTSENSFVINMIKKLKELGVPYSEMAALYRTSRSQRALIEMLRKEDIPFATDGEAINIYEHWIAEDIYAYLRIIEGGKSRQDYIRVINRPYRNIRREMFGSEEVDIKGMIINASEVEKTALKKFYFTIINARKLSTFAAINYILNVCGYKKYLKGYAKSHAIEEEELYTIAEELLESAKDYPRISDWFIWVLEAKDFALPSTEHIGDAVRVTTMHKSKGLEYEVVFLPDINEGLVPYRLAKLQPEIEEERRLFYVAVTRAKKWLFILHTRSRYNKPQAPSRFIREMLE